MKEVPQGYKKTEVGLVPEDWALFPISTVTAPVRPPIKLEATSYLPVGDYPVITQGAEPITAYCNEVSYLVEEGNYILFGDHTCYVKRHCGSFAQGADGLKILKIKQNRILFDFCYYSFDYYSPKPTGYNRHWTSAKKTLLPTPLKRYEQQAIATALSDMDALIEAKEALLEKKRAIKQGAMQELLTGKRRLPGFPVTPMRHTDIGDIPEDWEVRELGEVANYSRNNEQAFYPESCAYVSCENMLKDRGGVILSSRAPMSGTVAKFDKGDILLGNIRPYLKKIWLSDKKGTCSADVLCIRTIVNPAFLYAILARDVFFLYVMSNAKGTKMPRGDKQHIMQYKFPLPLTEEEQRAIATALSDMDAEIQSLEQEIAKLRDLKKGMMQELLTGRIRLVKLKKGETTL